MKMTTKSPSSFWKSPVRYVYVTTVFFLALTGFGQMPIFKRYYIADIPGLGWLAQFYVTHYIHYLAAILLFALAGYAMTDYIAARANKKITASGYIRGAILAGLILTGILLVIRNFDPGRLTPGFIIFLDLSHLALVMVFLMAALYCAMTKKRWTAPAK